ncbi:MAG: alpha/beta hydrolase [Synergistaceae bacterium]|nr:alpha/beta hydrolase [Synergistaceae bacterium]
MAGTGLDRQEGPKGLVSRWGPLSLLYEGTVEWREGPEPRSCCVDAPAWLAAPPSSWQNEELSPSSAALWPEGKDLVIVVHGIGVEGVLWKLYERVIAGLQREGTACALLFIPGHGPRAKGHALAEMARLSVGEALAMAHGGVSEIRSLARWGRKRYRSVRLLGVSLGGMLSTIALALEPEIEGGLLAVTGGDLSRIVRHGVTRLFLAAGGGAARAAARCGGPAFAAYEKQVRLEGWRHVEPPSPACLVDPLTFGPLVGRKRARMVLTRWDPVVPYGCGVALWRALGRPPLDRVPGAHGSVLLFHRDLIVRRLTRWPAKLKEEDS